MRKDGSSSTVGLHSIISTIGLTSGLYTMTLNSGLCLHPLLRRNSIIESLLPSIKKGGEKEQSLALHALAIGMWSAFRL